jgi:hypothetical protein
MKSATRADARLCETCMATLRGSIKVKPVPALRYRPHKASIVEECSQTFELKHRSDLVSHLRKVMDRYNARWTPPEPVVVTEELVEIRPFVSDDPNNDMQVVIVKSWGVMGFVTTAAYHS